MLRLASLFLIVAMATAVVGFGGFGLLVSVAEIAQILFLIFFTIFLLALMVGIAQGSRKSGKLSNGE